MKKYDITGMSCAACVARVEKAVSKVDGVSSVAVNLLTNSMNVEGTATDNDVISAVESAGYGCKLQGGKAKSENTKEDNPVKPMLKRLGASVVVMVVLMYFSMGHMFHLPLPSALSDNHLAVSLIQLLLSALIMVINQKFFINGFKGLVHRSPNMDTLVAMGSSVSFLWSVWILMKMTVEPTAELMHQLYFESAAMILVLITVGKTLEAYSKGKTTNALKALMKLAPKTAVVERNGQNITVAVDEVSVGDVFIVEPGMSIPVDGMVLDGSSAVDESALTGESVPVDKAVNSKVYSATMNKSGYLKCRATAVGEDTSLSKIIQMVSDASAGKAPVAKIADKVSAVFVPFVMVIALITFVVWLLCGAETGFAIARGVSVLVISCPCALGLATPVAIMVGNGVGAKNGILFKTAEILENAGKTQIIALDKTGTITEGKPVVTDVIPVSCNKEELLSFALSVESRSEHPLGKAVVKYCSERHIKQKDITDFTSLSGNGVKATFNSKEIYGGSLKFISSLVKIDDEIKQNVQSLSDEGKTPLLFAYDNKLVGIIAVADTVKKDSKTAIEQLKNLGLRVVMLTGDNERTAKAIAKQCGVDEVYAGVLPGDKERIVSKLMAEGKVAMVGDGINDAPALTRADVGIAIGAGTDVAVDSADIVLENSKLTDVPASIRLSRATLNNIRQNLFWAFCYNIIGIPLAAGVFISAFGWELNPMFGAAAMSVSSFLVVSNALRLNLFRLYSPKHDRKIKQLKIKEYKTMEKTVKINGMMCPHCEGRMKQAFEALDEVDSAVTSHVNKNAVLTLNAELSDEKIKATVEAAGYEYVG